jgi:hypothetical protein
MSLVMTGDPVEMSAWNLLMNKGLYLRGAEVYSVLGGLR